MPTAVASLCLHAPATEENFDEAAYLRANPDVQEAVRSGTMASGRAHFDAFGRREGRHVALGVGLEAMRARKMQRLRPILRADMAHVWRGSKADYLTDALRQETRIADTSAVSSNDYDGHGLALVEEFADGLVLDCGAGSRGTYYENVVNYEIVDYASTDVLGVGEALPFEDGAFDAVISVAVLEHVRDPFRCAKEISRVLKPGGKLYCSVPFLQPYHGYPHHYFNATAQGVRRLFEDDLEVLDVDVIDSVHPIAALSWILSSWASGLPPSTRADFERMTVAELAGDPMALVNLPFCAALSKEKRLELACATVMHARKPVGRSDDLEGRGSL